MGRQYVGIIDSPKNIVDKLYVDKYAPVCSRTSTNTGSDGSSSTGTVATTFARTGRTLHRVLTGANALRFEYLNWYTQPNGSPGEVNNPNAVSYRASIEYPAGKWRQISGSTTWSSATAYAALDQVVYSGSSYVALKATTIATVPTSALGTEWQLVTRYAVSFEGQDIDRRVVVAAGGSAMSLPILLNIKEGNWLAVTTTVVTNNAANKFSGDIHGSLAYDFALDYPSAAPTVTTVDLVDKNVTTETNAAASTRIPYPSVIWGNTRDYTYIGIAGDSLGYGYGDTFEDSELKGFFVRAMDAENRLYRKVAIGADQLQFWKGGNAEKRVQLLEKADAVLCHLGANDITNGRTLAQLQADALEVWGLLGRSGARVWQTTQRPRSASTDTWATKVNQTPTSPAYAVGGVRDTWNAWLRGGASTVIQGKTLTAGQSGHPLTGVADISYALEDPADQFYYRSPGYTADGTHPTLLGHTDFGTALRSYIDRMLRPVPTTPLEVNAPDRKWSLGAGGQYAYVFRGGEIMSPAPAWACTKNQTLDATKKGLFVMMGYSEETVVLNGIQILYSNTPSATTKIAAYAGAAFVLNKVDSDKTIAAQNGYQRLAFSVPQRVRGAIGVYFFVDTSTTTPPTLLATPVSDSFTLTTPTYANFTALTPQNLARVVSIPNTPLTSLPASVDITLGGGVWILSTQIPFVAFY